MGKRRIRRVEVTILSQRYRLRSEHRPEYVQRLAQDVDRRMREIRENHATLSTRRIAILTSLQMMDELIRLRKQYDRVLRLLEDGDRERAALAAEQEDGERDEEQEEQEEQEVKVAEEAAEEQEKKEEKEQKEEKEEREEQEEAAAAKQRSLPVTQAEEGQNGPERAE